MIVDTQIKYFRIKRISKNHPYLKRTGRNTFTLIIDVDYIKICFHGKQILLKNTLLSKVLGQEKNIF